MNRVQINTIVTVCVAWIILAYVGYFNVYLPGVILILICIVIGIFAYARPEQFKRFKNELFPKSRKNETNEESATHQEKMTGEPVDMVNQELQPTQELKKDIERLEQSIDKLRDALQQQNEYYNKKFFSVYEQIKNLELWKQKIEECEKQKVEEKTIQDEQEVVPAVYYAQSVDSLQPFGFTTKGLTLNPDKSIFVLIIENQDEGKYKLIDDPDAQIGIINMFNPIITNSSDYDNIPAKIQRIYTSEPGDIRLMNGIWQIIKKQKVNIE